MAVLGRDYWNLLCLYNYNSLILPNIKNSAAENKMETIGRVLCLRFNNYQENFCELSVLYTVLCKS